MIYRILVRKIYDIGTLYYCSRKDEVRDQYDE